MYNKEVNRRDLGSFFIDDIDSAQIMGMLRQKSSYGYIVTPNIDHVQRLYRLSPDDSLSKIYREAKLSLCDSRILQKIMKMSGNGSPTVVTGSGLTAEMFEVYFNGTEKIVIIGGDESIIGKIRQRYPHLNIAHKNPSMGFIFKPDEVIELGEFCRAEHGSVILLAVGSPQQEILASELSRFLNDGTAMCVGASLNFIVGAERRAPEFLQRLHCEWLYRLLMNPRRLIKRYLSNLYHVAGIYLSLSRLRKSEIDHQATQL